MSHMVNDQLGELLREASEARFRAIEMGEDRLVEALDEVIDLLHEAEAQGADTG